MNSIDVASGVFFIRYLVNWAHRGSYMFFAEEIVQPLESPDPLCIQTLYFESRLRYGGSNKSNFQENNYL